MGHAGNKIKQSVSFIGYLCFTLKNYQVLFLVFKHFKTKGISTVVKFNQIKILESK